ncbi:MAG: tetratricopeptide repeat protein [Terracidiphilus sp.]
MGGCATLGSWASCTGPQQLEAKLRKQPDVHSYTNLGVWFSSHNQYACAVESFRAASRLAPQSAQLSYLLGLNLCSSGRVEEALGPLRKSIEIDPANLKPYLILATALDQLQRGDEARAQWKAALKIDPTSTIALDGLSKSMIASGDYLSAIKLLRTAASNENLSIDLAFAYSKAGMLDRAVETLTGALRATPSSLRLSNALATVYANQRRFEDASALLERSLRLHPQDEDAQRIYLRVLVLSGNTANARPLAAKLLVRDPHSFDVLNLNGILDDQAEDYAAARKHLDEAVTLNPNDSSSRYYLGLALAHLQDSHGAREQFEKAVALDPSSPEAHFQFATILRVLGETQLAQEQFKLSQEMSHAKTQLALAGAKASAAAQQLADGNFQQAVALYREAVEAAPESALLAYQLSVALNRAGDTAAERAALEQAIRLDPNLSIAQYQLGRLIVLEGDPAAAEDHFRHAVQATPEYTEAWISLAATLGAESRFSEALDAVAKALQLDPDNASANQLKSALTAAQSHP